MNTLYSLKAVKALWEAKQMVEGDEYTQSFEHYLMYTYTPVYDENLNFIGFEEGVM